MAHTREDILDILVTRLTDESMLLLGTLMKIKEPIAKEELWRAANQVKKSTDPKKENVINSRYTLDTSIARLEGAGLLNVKAYGRIRTYTVSELGYEFYQHYKNTYRSEGIK
ncbi:hypothetical protein [Planomicrobium okeanokoites]|uniref:hypothetical protein n=1 Tax=Planomicrobium okeanokoites TaxID=244 RepID=UPI0009FDFAC8|nr:hypothetical protein [Planomicrobium okeanokoites]